MAVSIYDPELFDSFPHGGWTDSQRRAGGRARAAKAKRHPAYGIFLPDTPLFDNLFPSTYEHGKAGGQARAIKAHRDARGRFVKE